MNRRRDYKILIISMSPERPHWGRSGDIDQYEPTPSSPRLGPMDQGGRDYDSPCNWTNDPITRGSYIYTLQ